MSAQISIHQVVRMVVDTRRLKTADGEAFMVEDYTIFSKDGSETNIQLFHDDGLSVVHNVEPSPR